MERNNIQFADARTILLLDLKRELNAEMKKPSGKRNADKIRKLTENIYELSYGKDKTASERMEISKNQLYRKLKQPQKKSVMLCKRLAAAVASVLVILGANAVSLKVFGKNIFASVYHMGKDGLTWRSYESPEENSSFVNDTDPYNIGKRISEWSGCEVIVPTYMPDDFKEIEYRAENDRIIFYFGKDGECAENECIFLSYEKNSGKHSLTTPCDDYAVMEICVDGFDGTMFEEDTQLRAFFPAQECDIFFSALNVSYKESEKVLFKMKTYPK